jgi:hypothetical protein
MTKLSGHVVPRKLCKDEREINKKPSTVGLPDGIFSNKNPNLGKLWRVLQWEMLEYFNGHLVYFPPYWYFFPCFGLLQLKIWQPWSKDGMYVQTNIIRPAMCLFLYTCNCEILT